jgi:ribose-phosphate pyrophosphokinase
LIFEMDIRFFSGTESLALAQAVAARLRIPVARKTVKRFPDGELYVHLEETVRGRDVYILQSTSPPVHEQLMELLITIDTFRRAAAGRITAIIPYFGYSRQEKMSAGREPITARLVADLLATSGANRVVSIDLHNSAMQGFFSIGMDHLTAVQILLDHLQRYRQPDRVVVSPDAGRVKLAERYARGLQLPLVILHKERIDGAESEVRAVIGEVRDRRPIIIDDMITSGGTIIAAVKALLAAGAKPEMVVAATHGVLVGDAMHRLSEPSITDVVITDTVAHGPGNLPSKVTVLSVAGLLSETVRRLNEDRSVSELFPAR